MSNLVPYDLDLDALETDILELSLSEACEKYKNWAQHKGGACDFRLCDTWDREARDRHYGSIPKFEPPSSASFG